MPEPIVKKLQEVLKKAMDNPEHVKKLEDQGIAIKIMVGEEYAKYFADAHAKAKKYTEWAKNRPQKCDRAEGASGRRCRRSSLLSPANDWPIGQQW